MIEVNNLHKSFSENEVLKGIDAKINTGEVVVIIEIGRASCRERV